MSKIVFSLFIILMLLLVGFTSLALVSESADVIKKNGFMSYLGLKDDPSPQPDPRELDYVEPQESELERLQREQVTISPPPEEQTNFFSQPSPTPYTYNQSTDGYDPYANIRVVE